MYKQSTKPTRIEPNRKWFGNVRTISQKELESFRSEMNQQVINGEWKSNNPNEMVLKKRSLPMSLLVEQSKDCKMNLLEVEKFEVNTSSTRIPSALSPKGKNPNFLKSLMKPCTTRPTETSSPTTFQKTQTN